MAWQIADHKEIPQRDQSQVLEITVEFDSKIVPITRPATLVDLLNAGWKCHQKKNLFPNIPHVREEAISREDKYRVLGDLMLKSMEVSETIKRRKRSL